MHTHTRERATCSPHVPLLPSRLGTRFKKMALAFSLGVGTPRPRSLFFQILCCLRFWGGGEALATRPASVSSRLLSLSHPRVCVVYERTVTRVLRVKHTASNAKHSQSVFISWCCCSKSNPTAQTTIQDQETEKEFSAVNCYFMQQDGSTFKAQVKYAPYFLLATKPNCEHDVEAGGCTS
jgi:hypothetical protein